MSALGRGHVGVVAAAHCASAFAALGLPPYLGVLLPQLGDPAASWAGVLYVVPTLCTALSASLWGRLADRVGPKPLLVRAQLGLAAAFGLAAIAQDLPTLVAALVAQGVLGGTYSASTAYLASGLEGERLSRALALMQGSARTALVAAPVLAGLLSGLVDVRQMYGLAALLPLAAAAAMVRMPALGRAVRPRPATATAGEAVAGKVPQPSAITVLGLCLAEAGFVLVTVSTYPYFVPYVHHLAPGLPAWAPGVLFAAPHLAYLASAAIALRLLQGRARTGLGAAYGAAALSGLVHAVPALLPGQDALAWVIAGRALLGTALALGLPSLTLLASEAAAHHRPGRLFGRVETGSKSGAVLAGLGASALAGAGPVLGAAPLAIPLAAGAVLAASVRSLTASRAVPPPASSPVPASERSLA
ncbi:MFS transporter [Sinomonas sp. B1-1]|uniref:MFS transporter n=1 Tax=Sinomonas sp. B1-1 TaxID=3141454 RepID=UPI003D2E2956